MRSELFARLYKDIICPFRCWSGTAGVKAMVGKTADTLSWIKAVTPDCHSGFHPVSLKNVLDKAGEMIGFIKSQLLRTHLFNVPYDEMVIVLKALLLVENHIV